MKHIYTLLVAIFSIATTWGQETDFNPSNPAEPGQRYQLTLQVSPANAGSVNGAGQYDLGKEVQISAYANTNYRFVCWKLGEDSISNASRFSYTIPAADTELTACFEFELNFNPSSPDEPTPPVPLYKVNLTASPANAGSFNISSGNPYKEGSEVSVYAYPESGYKFAGWQRNGETISTDSEYTFTIQGADVDLTALFRFSPSNPANPGANYYNSETGEVIIDDFTPGDLMSAIDKVIGGSGNRNSVTMVTVAGIMEYYDLGITNYLSNCTLLDLSRTGGYTTIPSYAFDGSNLVTIILPACVEQIGSYAFENCESLTNLTCYAMTPPTLESGVFNNTNSVLVVYVLSNALPMYSEAEGWKELTLLPLLDEVRSLTVSLPSGTGEQYKNMILELVNAKNRQKQRYALTGKESYTFNGLLKNCTYYVSLKTPSEGLLGEIQNIEIKEEDKTVAFTSLTSLQNIQLKVATPEGTDVTEQVQVTWMTSEQTYLAQGAQLDGRISGEEVVYRLELNQTLGMQYTTPNIEKYVVKENDNQITVTLVPIEKKTITGTVTDEKGGKLSNAVISVSQKLNGKYSKSFITQTNNKGIFSVEVFNAASTIAVSANEYISHTISSENFDVTTDLGTISLKPIEGAIINLSYTYTNSVASDETAETIGWYSDYENITYSIYNNTTAKEISQFVAQYPQIIILDGAAINNHISIKATSKKKAFSPVEATTIINEEEEGEVLFNIVEWGGIQATYKNTENTEVVGILYNSNGELVKKYNYSSKSLSIKKLPDGKYTLITMAGNAFFNAILKLSQLQNTGLAEGTDYVSNSVTIKSGLMTQIANETIPVLDESKLYYTGENTSFTTNKSSIVAGNYLTLKAKLDFKDEYASQVDNINLIVDLPESCSFVDGSMMVGSQIADYILEDNRLTIPMSNYSDQVRFCIIPTAGGTYSPNAFVEFTIGNKQVQQPIGAAHYEVKDLTISVPSTVAKTTIPITGTAIGISEISIYDNDILIGQTTSLANGMWSAMCELNEASNLSTHHIYAKVLTKQGLELQSETQEVTYDMSFISVNKVTMYYNEYTNEFDFQNPSRKEQTYTYSSNTDFTFTIEFNNNDPEKISDVVLYVKTMANTWVPLSTIFDEKKQLWVATTKSSELNSYPVNVSVDYNTNYTPLIDSKELSAALNLVPNLQAEIKRAEAEIEELAQLINIEYQKESYDRNYIDSLENEINMLLNITPEEVDVSSISVEEFLKELEKEEINCISEGFTNINMYDIDNLTDYLTGIEIKTCNGLEPAQLIKQGYTPLEKTDGSMFYQLQTDSLYSFADFKENIYISMLINQISTIQTKATFSDNICDKVTAANIEINKFWDKIREYASTGLSFLTELADRLIEENAKHGERLKKIQALCKKDIDKKTLARLQKEFETLSKKVTSNDKILKIIDEKLISSLDVAKAAGKGFSVAGLFFTVNEMIEKLNKTCALYSSVPECPQVSSSASTALKNEINNWGKNACLFYTSNMAITATEIVATTGGLAAIIPSGGTSLSITIAALGVAAAQYIAGVIYNKQFDATEKRLQKRITQLELKCDEECSEPPCSSEEDNTPNEDDNPNENDNPNGDENLNEDDNPTIHYEEPQGQQSYTPDCKPAIDPSGYVYEAVPSNRLEGVTATCYYKETVEDMYGDLHEEVRLWDAAEYAQENPLFTDKNGMYRWDVPQGLWQVKFEKEGYETAYSDWLPVPPPQLEVNIGMTQNVQPTVNAVRGYDAGIEVDFSKYMLPETMTTELITVTRNGEPIEGSILFVNSEKELNNESIQYVSKVSFVPSTALKVGDVVTINVSRSVKSYAGIMMENDYSQEIVIEKKPKTLLASDLQVIYNQTKELVVSVEPTETAAGKKISVHSISPLIASITPAEATLNEFGQATFTVSGELLGSTVLLFTASSMDLTSEVKVNVVEASKADYTQEIVLEKGWNWISPNVKDHNLNELTSLFEPIKEVAIILKGEEETSNYHTDKGWQGTLTSLKATDGYKLKVSKNATLKLTGKSFAAKENTITLTQGWNWMGYTPIVVLPINEALQNLPATTGDIVKSIDAFAVYDGTTWNGSLAYLVPGEAYLAYSQSTKSFNYPEVYEKEHSLEIQDTQWTYDKHASEENMVAVARLYNGTDIATSKRYVLGVFVGDECRGIGTEINGIFYLTIHGSSNETFKLRAYDTSEQKEYNIQETFTWSEVIKGSLNEPEALHIGTLTDIEYINEEILIYPNPMRKQVFIHGDIGKIEEVRIINVAGQIVLLHKQLLPNSSIDVSTLSPGVYFILVKTDTKIIRQKIMKVE